MQEVVKRMQEKQERETTKASETPRVKADQYVSLCIVKTSIGNYPIVLPTYSVNVGDLVWFPIDGGTIQGEVMFVGRCSPEDDLWNGLVVAMQMEPVVAIKYASMTDVKWED
jgi:hypothetical protein